MLRLRINKLSDVKLVYWLLAIFWLRETFVQFRSNNITASAVALFIALMVVFLDVKPDEKRDTRKTTVILVVGLLPLLLFEIARRS